jgi:hypothetical protein
MMKLFTCTDHDSFYPVGVSSIILADSKEEAAWQLSIALGLRGLEPEKGFTLEEVDLTVRTAIILNDGNY